MAEPLPKDFDSLLEAAFEAGVRTGAGYPSYDAIPSQAEDDAYRLWRERWAGLPREDHGGATEKARRPIVTQAEVAQAAQYWRMAEESLATRLGHPGGHYG